MREVEISGCRIDPALLIQLSNLLKDVNENLVEIIWKIEQGSSLVTHYLAVIQAIKNNESPKIPIFEEKLRELDEIHSKPKRIRNHKAVNPLNLRTGLSLNQILLKLPVGEYTIEECTKFVLDSDYKSKSKSLQVLVYQKICILVRQGIFKKYGVGPTARFKNTNAPIVVENKENNSINLQHSIFSMYKDSQFGQLPVSSAVNDTQNEMSLASKVDCSCRVKYE